jgi:hypothetical protein
MISALNSFIVLSLVASILNAHFQDVAHLDTAVHLMCVMEGKLMGTFALKILNVSIISVILGQIARNRQIKQQKSIKTSIKATESH